MEPEEVYTILTEAYFGENRDEAEELELLNELLKNCNTFIDIGASLGQYTKEANSIMSNATIYSVEADPLRFSKLEQLASEWLKNSNRDNQIICLQLAAGEKNGATAFYTESSNKSGSTSLIQHRLENIKPIMIEQRRIDELASDFAGRVLIKLDIEGGEYRALRGMPALLGREDVDFLLEVHPWGDQELGISPVDVLSVMERHGYQVYQTYEHHFFSKTKSHGQNQNYFLLKIKLWLRYQLRKSAILFRLRKIFTTKSV